MPEPKQGLLQGEWDTDIIREARKAVQRGEEGERPCQKGTCQGEGDSDGGLVRNTERALRPEASQGPDEAGGLLKRKHAHGKVLSRGNYASVIDNGQKIRPKRPE